MVNVDGGRGKDNVEGGHAFRSALVLENYSIRILFFDIIEVLPDWKYL